MSAVVLLTVFCLGTLRVAGILHVGPGIMQVAMLGLLPIILSGFWFGIVWGVVVALILHAITMLFLLSYVSADMLTGLGGAISGIMAACVAWLSGFAGAAYRTTQDDARQLAEEHDRLLKEMEARKRVESDAVTKATMLDRTDDAIFVCNLHGDIQYVNESACTSLGYLRNELVGQSLAKITVSDGYGARLKELVQKGRIRFNAQHRRKDGTLLAVEVNASIVTVGEDPVVMGVVRDVGDRAQAEKALRDSEERYRLLFEQAVDGILIGNLDGTVLNANTRMCELSGYAREELINRHVALLFGRDELSRVPFEFDALNRGRTVVSQRYLRRKDGSELPIEMTTKRLPNDTYQSFYRDVSERRAAEEAVVVAKDEVERSNMKLRMTVEHANQMAIQAQAASVVKSHFLANMSHEIRTPMNAVLGFTDLVLESQLDDEQRQYLQIVKQRGADLLTLINDILDLSKIEADKLALTPVIVSVRQVVAEAVEMIRLKAGEKGLSVTVDVAENVPEAVVTDPLRLRQILMNLLSNSVKFTSKGSIGVQMGVAPTGPMDKTNSLTLAVSVSDSGMGIPADKHAGIFQPFTQIDSGTSRKFGGTGLGLSIVRRLVELMGGRIWFESEEKRGTTFHFTLQAGIAASVPEYGRPPSAPQVPVPPLRILLAEDDAPSRLLASSMLRKMGHEVVAVENGVEACRIWEPDEFHLVLMDVSMPEMDGFQATGVIREKEQADPKHGTMPIVALTAHAMREDRERCARAGMDDYVAKPVSAEALLAVMVRLMETGRLRAGTIRP